MTLASSLNSCHLNPPPSFIMKETIMKNISRILYFSAVNISRSFSWHDLMFLSAHENPCFKLPKCIDFTVSCTIHYCESHVAVSHCLLLFRYQRTV
jgi:hypothetical protein